MSETLPVSQFDAMAEYDPDTLDSLHDPVLADDFSRVLVGQQVSDGRAEQASVGTDTFKVGPRLFGANLMTTVLEDPETINNFSMTRSGGAWGENE